LLAAGRSREKPGGELLAAAAPRGLWDVHLADVPGLRDFACRWFHNIEVGYVVFDLIQVFGPRSGPTGHDEPVPHRGRLEGCGPRRESPRRTVRSIPAARIGTTERGRRGMKPRG